MKDERDLIDQDVPYDPTEGRTQSAQNQADRRVEVSPEAYLYSGNGKDSQANGIEKEEGPSEVDQALSEENGHKGSRQDEKEVFDLHHPCHRCATDQDVAQASSPYGSDQGNNDYTKGVELFIHGCQATRDGEDEGTDIVQEEEEGHPLVFLYFNDHGDLHYAVAGQTDLAKRYTGVAPGIPEYFH